MKLKYCDGPKPEIVDGWKVKCFVYEDFRIKTGEVYEANLGFVFEDLKPMVSIRVVETNMLFAYGLDMPFVKFINFSYEDMMFKRGDFLCYLGLSLNFKIKKEW